MHSTHTRNLATSHLVLMRIANWAHIYLVLPNIQLLIIWKVQLGALEPNQGIRNPLQLCLMMRIKGRKNQSSNGS